MKIFASFLLSLLAVTTSAASSSLDELMKRLDRLEKENKQLRQIVESRSHYDENNPPVPSFAGSHEIPESDNTAFLEVDAKARTEAKTEAEAAAEDPTIQCNTVCKFVRPNQGTNATGLNEAAAQEVMNSQMAAKQSSMLME